MDYIIIFLLISGTFFFFVGVVGLLRLPDVYTRIHATTKCDTLGAGLLIFGCHFSAAHLISNIKISFCDYFYLDHTPHSGSHDCPCLHIIQACHMQKGTQTIDARDVEGESK